MKLDLSENTESIRGCILPKWFGILIAWRIFFLIFCFSFRWVFFFFFREASLVVNVASDCRYTDKSYLTLKELHKEFGPYHFNVLAFPCNQFGESEPMSSMEIESFARQNYGVTFPIFHKIKILGPEAEPAFRFLVGKYLPCLNVVHSFPFHYYTYIQQQKIYK